MPSMKLLAKNLRAVYFAAGKYSYALYFSYETLIAFEFLHVLYWNADKFSATTEKHLKIVRSHYALNMQDSVNPYEWLEALNAALCVEHSADR